MRLPSGFPKNRFSKSFLKFTMALCYNLLFLVIRRETLAGRIQQEGLEEAIL